ncbi:CvpA family protein [Paludisphaera rhizosphaerae]|uniref:CvpA family protein n=1 Tax=Paludisphaera rhizosphaerae TaxID=2711216 RepID=UPI0013EC25D0|nr:CvpA family protein [Paludisphaera rhizosphaerae]
MTIYDGIMAAVLIAGMIRGAWRGITWQLASLGSLVLGYLFSYPISAVIAPKLPGTPEAARAMSMAAAYVVVSCAVFAAAWMVRNVLSRMKFEAYDRHLGMMLGGAEGIAVGILGTMLVTSVAPTTRDPIFASTSGKIVTAVVGVVGPILPAEVRTALAPYWQGGGSSTPAVAEADAATSAEAGADAPASTPAPDATIASRAAALVDGQVGKAGKVDAASATTPAPADAAAPLPSAREVMDQFVERGRQKAEQVLTESLDSDPNAKAASIRELYEKDKNRLKDAVLGTVDQTKQNVAGQLQGAVDQTKRDLSQQIQNRTGNLQGQAADAQKRMEEYRARVARAQQGINRARQQLQQGADGAVNAGRKKLEESLSDAIDKGLDKLGLPDAPPPATPK